MYSRLQGFGIATVAALALAAATPLTAGAGTIGFRNDTDSPVTVQGMSVVRGVIRQGKKQVIQPGAISWDVIVAPGNKIITVADAKNPTRMLAQETIQVGAANVFYSIQTNDDTAAEKADKTNKPDKPEKSSRGDKGSKSKKDSSKTQITDPKVKLVQTKAPVTTPMGSTTPMPRR